MSRPQARITHDEVTRILKAVTKSGFVIDQITYRDLNLHVNNGDIGDKPIATVDLEQEKVARIRGPKL